MQMNENNKLKKMELYLENAKNNGLPKDAYLQVGYSCNAKCIMCNIWKNPFIGDIDVLYSIINKLSELNFEWITFWGGEPLLHPLIDDLIIFAKKKNLKVQIITNGSLIKDHIDIICNLVDNLVVSIDSGLPEIHDKIRNTKGIYYQATEGIKELLKENKHPNIELDCTILNENIDTLESIVELSNNLGKIFIDFDPVQISGVGNNSKYEFQSNISGLFNAKKLAEDYGIEITSKERMNLIEKYLKKEKIVMPCYSYCKDLLISPKGDVYACWTIGDIIGNILDDNFVQEWNNGLFNHKNILTGHKKECYNCGFSHSRMPDKAYLKIVKKANKIRLRNIKKQKKLLEKKPD